MGGSSAQAVNVPQGTKLYVRNTEVGKDLELALVNTISGDMVTLLILQYL